MTVKHCGDLYRLDEPEDHSGHINKLLVAKDLTSVTRLKAILQFHQYCIGKNKRLRPRELNPGQHGLGKADGR